MKNDDVQVGRLLSRREVLGLMGAAGMALLVGCSGEDDPAAATATSGSSPVAAGATEAATSASSSTATSTLPSCIVKPESTEGPYFVDEMLNRSDIRSDPTDGSIVDGAEFKLTFLVSKIGSSCEALEGATVDVWHCDASGAYSGFLDPNFDARGKQFLRGYQVTDASGKAEFTSIYPGWYDGRAVHIHFKIRTTGGDSDYDFTSQLYFDDAFTDEVYQEEPYAAKGERTVRNEQDGIFAQDGPDLTLVTTKNSSGYEATFEIGLQI